MASKLPRVTGLDALRSVPARGSAITVLIEQQPPREASKNSRADRWTMAKATREYRRAARLSLTSVINGLDLHRELPSILGDGELALDVTIGWGRGRCESGRPRHDTPLDPDNARTSLKAALDGLADALDTNDRRFDVVACRQVRDDDGLGWTLVTIFAKEPAR